MVEASTVSAFDIPFPPTCLGCASVLREPACALPLCAPCRAGVARIPAAEALVDGIESLYPYEGGLVRAVARLKYGRALALAGPLGRLLAAATSLAEAPDVVVPVPQHLRRTLWRGHDPVREMSRWALASLRADAPRLDPRLLRRPRHRPPQAGLSAQARRRSPEGSFRVSDARRVEGRRVLMIDDVTTTGSTLQACRRVLLAAGAAEVRGLALLRACA